MIMPTIEIGCGQITWSNDTPEEQVLAEIAQAGYAGAPAGLSAGRTAEQAQALYARHGLKPAPGYLVRFQRGCWVLGVGRAALRSPTPNTQHLKPCLEMH